MKGMVTFSFMILWLAPREFSLTPFKCRVVRMEGVLSAKGSGSLEGTCCGRLLGTLWWARVQETLL